MKKAIAILLVYSILMTLLVVSPFTANADEKSVAETGDIVASGTTGDCTWKIEDGVLTISGNGKMEDNNSPWRSYDFNTVVIENGVTSIGGSAFYGCTGLTSVTIPDSVTSIGRYAFSGCTGLTSVTIPDSVTSIGYSVFYQCNNLKTVQLNQTAVNYFKSAFTVDSLYTMKNIESITISDSVIGIGIETFSQCPNLKNVDLGNSVEAIGERAFYNNTEMTSVTVPKSVTVIQDKALGYYYLTGIGDWKIKDFTIFGYTGSEAERYAIDNGFAFVQIDGQPTEPTQESTTTPSDPTKTTDREIFGDIDGDGAITVVDSTFLQRYTIQAETPYPIGEKMK